MGLVLRSFLAPAAACPRCQAAMRVPKHFEMPGRCESCGDWAYRKGGVVTAVPAGFVAKIPAFEVTLDRLRLELGTWTFPSVERCCVCGGPATTKKKLDVESRVLVEDGLVSQTVLQRKRTFEIGWCAGANCGEPFDNDYFNRMRPVRFRSYDFWKQVWMANKRA